LDRFGHTIYDLDFGKPTPAEEPAPLLETLKFFLSDQIRDPYERQGAASSARNQAVQTTLARLRGPRRVVFERTLRIAQGFAPLREDALADVGLGWPVLRRMLFEIGERLAKVGVVDGSDDIFWLKADELQTLTGGLDSGQSLADYRQQVAERRAAWVSERRVAPPLALPPKEGMRFMGMDWSSLAPARTDQAQGDTIHGTGTSPGRVSGTARLIYGPEAFDQMQHGDILVARITTPAWTPLFVLAGGVVTDIGGPLSHGSIVAREYHIPAVLGTGVATERIRSGQHVIVDGDAGTVTLPATKTVGPSAPPPESAAGDKGQQGRRRILRLGLAAAAILAVVWLYRKRRRRR
jgi:pyruvate,water dikinase